MFNFSFGLIWMQYSLVIVLVVQSEGLKFSRRVRLLLTLTEKIALEGSKILDEFG